MLRLSRTVVIIFPAFIALVIAICGCGRMGAPLAPEQLSPQSVQDLVVIAEPTALRFSWRSPDSDQRGKELKSMNGYYVMRRTIERPADLTDPAVDFERLAVIVDSHVVERDRLRKEAREAGRPSHRVAVPANLKQFEFRDTNLIAGGRYLYRIVPVNQETVEGQVRQPVKVIFRGEASEISFLDRDGDMADFFQE